MNKMNIYDFSTISFIPPDETAIVNMNAALLTFHTEKEILAFRNTHLKWLLLYDLKLDDTDYLHARMAFNAYGDIVTVQGNVSAETLDKIKTIADFCKGNVMIDVRYTDQPDLKARTACRHGVKYVIGAEVQGMISCKYAMRSYDLPQEIEDI